MSLEARMGNLEGLVRRLLTRVGEGTDAVSSVFGRTGAVAAADNDYTEAQISFSDITTNNASTTKHGYLKKLDNNANNFMNGQGNWAAPSSSDTDKIAFITGGNPIGADGTNDSFALAGYNGIGATENDRQTIIPIACTLQKAYVRVTANSYGSPSTFTVRLNEASTSIVVTVTASTTGTFSDTSNTAAAAAGDRAGWLFAGGATVTYNGTACYGVVV